MNILNALDDAKVFGGFFRTGSWAAWRVFLAALFALPMTEEQLAVYRRHTGRTTPPTAPLHEAWLVCGRRGGKSFVLATIAVFIAGFKDWRRYLAPGEVGVIMIIAADRRQARVIMRYCTGLLKAVPMLAKLIAAETRETIELRNSITIEIHTASFRTTRGYTIVAALLDELAYWATDETSAEPDTEVINAVRPGMSTIPDAVLLCASSPYARKGALWNAHRRHYGQDGDEVLVWQADTRSMNPSVPQSYIDKHIAEDAARAAAEYGAQFRSDIEGFVAREVVDAATVSGRYELPPIRGIAYSAFVDPSGGSADSMTLAIAHLDKDGRAVLDAARERRPPFSPDDVVIEFAALLKCYGIRKVTGDRYGGEWPSERFRARGIEYIPSERSKGEIYRELLPLLNGGKAELLDLPRLATQLTGLERRTARGGRDSIDHAPGAHDDFANCVAGSLLLATTGVPTLWRQEALLIDGKPVGAPRWCDAVFAVLMAGRQGEAAVVYFALTVTGKAPLAIILDWGVTQLAPALFKDVFATLAAFRKAVPPRFGVRLFTPRLLAEEMSRLGYPAFEVDDMAAKDEELLSLTAATHIGLGHVKITTDALARAEHKPLGGILDATTNKESDPLRTAVLIGIALSFDTDRSLGLVAA
jgi:hypothetical protein